MTNRINIERCLPVLLSAILFAGCALVGPDYQPPAMTMGEIYLDSGISQSLGDIAAKRWWEGFDDPVLNDLVAKGLAQNLDIGLAIERITAARATLRGRGINDAISGDLSYSSTRTGSDTTATQSTTTTSLSSDIIIDLFGGIRRAQQAAAAQLHAAIDDVETARLAYLSELIGAYIDARYYQYSIKLTQRSIETRKKTLAITQKQHAVGAGTELDIEQVKALLYAAQADIPDMEASYLSKIYTIATLLNEPAAELVKIIDESQKGMALLGLNLKTEYDTGIPADLLRNRPDVRSAEQDLIAATAEIGVAIANMLPSISLSGSITDFKTTSWSFGPTITLPIFNQGALAAERDLAVSEAKQAEITWRQTVLDAVQDVQSANSAWLRDRDKVKFLKQSVESYQRSLDLSLETYEAGVMTLLDLLDTDRSLAAARIDFADSLRDMSTNWATLQVALGAGAKAAP